MPFTLSHAAAALPLARGPLVPAALVVGTVAPDVPYFVKVPRYAGAWYEPFVNATTTHHWPGALTVAVPTAAALLAVWWVVRAPLAALVTHGRTPRPDDGAGRLERAAWVLVSLVLGVATHVLWDSFTHGDGFLVESVDALRRPAFAGMDVARVLQHLSTVVGLVVLAVWLGRWAARWRGRGGRLEVTGTSAAVLGGLVVLGLTAAGVALAASIAQREPVEATLARLVTTSGAAVAAAVVAYAAVWWAVGRTTTVRRPVRLDETA
ncbi:DUF4184 family protein [Cellulomonas uda]|uniref:DUF4184 domain-containing protein n=1 Tax=Cellulomonas uda TaxID=1714 RepID=A0A4Y3KE97_CELUD|nr:DUF4184 family protein [Cellulomonas uda]NII67564.1 putative membrane protein [Cellulomonas uda]GEA81355.1 hypothetical protein CUD01_17990 [Cellulomonas uda]